MGQKNPISVSFNLPDGKEVIIETGKLATQAHGSVVVRCGNTMLLATVVSNKEPKPDMDYFPLSVDYQERFYSAGRIPGNFFRREGRLSDYEILTSRLVDRAIRPLFPDGYMCETQVILNLLSGESETMPDGFAALAASAALVLSDIPWNGPLSEVRIAKVNGEYITNPSRTQLKSASLEFIIAATPTELLMVEGEARECDESELIDSIKIAHEAIKIQCDAQLKLAELTGASTKPKRIVEVVEIDSELTELVLLASSDKIYEIARNPTDKQTRKNNLDAIKESVKAFVVGAKGQEFYDENKKIIAGIVDKNKKKIIRDVVLNEGKRLDGRKTDEVRPIWTEIDVLPAAHGSSIFNRGETQALGAVTLGSKVDKLLLDTAFEPVQTDFIFHYNFPGFSVGEAKPNRGPGRREVGHANLAARSVKKVLPADNPYTIRIVSDILESNGSTSMASVCVSSMALMDAGVKITAPISGIAMGLIKEGDKAAVLTDILGDEDALGDMDFKITGTEKGICGCQMDMKIEGLSYDLLESALAQAKEARLHILGEMAKTIDIAREDYKPHAPRIVEIRIPKSLIGAVIGPGGKVIQDIQATTGTVISIEEIENFGIVSIASPNKDSIDAAIARVNSITFVPEIGATYEAKVVEILSFGVVVDFKGKQGLLHVSEISHTRIENVEEVFNMGDELKVKLLDIDPRSGKYKLSRKALMPRTGGAPGGDENRESRGDRPERSDRGGYDRGGRGGDRGGRGRDDRDRDRGGDRGGRSSGGYDRGPRAPRTEHQHDTRPPSNEAPDPKPEEIKKIDPTPLPIEPSQPRPEGLNWED
ncbi:MAG: polyribonucleotide nucleotidyltransferase [Saprospiraceae bacterium]